jgi:hypothetical protein
MNGIRYQTRAHRGIARRFGVAPCSGSQSQPGRRPSGTIQCPGDATPPKISGRLEAETKAPPSGVDLGGTWRCRPMPCHREVSPVEIGLIAVRSRRSKGPTPTTSASTPFVSERIRCRDQRHACAIGVRSGNSGPSDRRGEDVRWLSRAFRRRRARNCRSRAPSARASTAHMNRSKCRARSPR